MSGIENIRKFLAAYDQHSVNGLRPGLADGFYGIDGGDESETLYGYGATLYISELRNVLKSHDALVAALINLMRSTQPGATAKGKHAAYLDAREPLKLAGAAE